MLRHCGRVVSRLLYERVASICYPSGLQAVNAKQLLLSSGCSSQCCSGYRQPRQRIHTQNDNVNGDKANTLLLEDDTIYALSTPSGRAGIAIIRISGRSCFDVYNGLCAGQPLPKARYASLRALYHPKTSDNLLDFSAVVLFFPAPKTVTGDDVLELHVHGGSATVKAVLAAIPQCPSRTTVRYAEPGEFTRRAFLNGKLDLSQIEALSDALSAETEQQRRAAVRGHSQNLGRIYDKWRHQLLYARGELEALIDFSEDQHFDESPSQLISSVAIQVQDMLNSIISHEYAGCRGELLKHGIRVSLLGPPNAGKSSLLNYIVGREASIISKEAGTTRDVVEVGLDIRGYLCNIADTAGLRNEEDKFTDPTPISTIEQEGIKRAKAKASESDVLIAMASIEKRENTDEIFIRYDAETLSIASKARNALMVINKCDSAPSSQVLENLLVDFKESVALSADIPLLAISCKDAALQEQSRDTTSISGNIDLFLDALVRNFARLTALPPELEDLLGVTERQRQLLSACSHHLKDFLAEAQSNAPESKRDDNTESCDIVLAAEHLRFAARCLARITGHGEAGDVEEVLGVVFEKFCVGK